MLLEEPEHMTPAPLMLPAFHGEAIAADAEMMAEVARREVAALAGRRAVRALAADAGDHPGGGDAGGLRARRRRPARTTCARRLTTLTEWMNEPRNLTALALLGPDWLRRSRGYREAMGPVEEAVLARGPPAPRRARRGAAGRRLDAGRRRATRTARRSSERELRDELLTLLTDGPTSTSLAWTFERLMRNPEKLERARARGRSTAATAPTSTR